MRMKKREREKERERERRMKVKKGKSRAANYSGLGASWMLFRKMNERSGVEADLYYRLGRKFCPSKKNGKKYSRSTEEIIEVVFQLFART